MMSIVDFVSSSNHWRHHRYYHFQLTFNPMDDGDGGLIKIQLKAKRISKRLIRVLV